MADSRFALLMAAALSCVSAGAVASDDNHAAELLATHCLACHGGDAGVDNRIAPPLAGVRQHYIGPYPDRDAFVAAVVAWTKQPDADQTLMPGAIRRFGLMPPIGAAIPDADLEQIAELLWRGDFAEPEWYREHYREEHGDEPRGPGRGRQGGGMGGGQGMRHGN